MKNNVLHLHDLIMILSHAEWNDKIINCDICGMKIPSNGHARACHERTHKKKRG